MAVSALARPGAALSRGWRELVLPIALVASVLVILAPVPSALLDLLLSVNIALAVIILLTTVYVRTPLEFSIFPSLLLATTLARLVLNIATTRLILTRAQTDGALAAGHVVRAFGDFVAGNQVTVGIVIFAIIIIIQFVVITKGATRISEVAARFALDGMPGKQLAIDADLNAGMIDQHEAQRRRQLIGQQADFYGAMDGAGKFIRGDAIAGILITFVNIIGGFIIGVAQHGMPFGQAAEVFTKLTIGDGLVAQVPAFLISIAAGLLVTRSSTETNLPGEFLRQLFSRPQALAVAAAFLGMLIFTKLPTIPLLLLGGGCILIALARSRQQQSEFQAAEKADQATKKKLPEDRIENYLSIDPMEIEIGLGLVRLADPKRGGDLLDRIQRVRQNVAGDLGIVMPKVRVRDNARLDSMAYRIKIADVPVSEGTLEPAMLLAIDTGVTTGKLRGIKTREPAFGTTATWIEPADREQAESYRYRVIEAVAALALHLTETVRRHADELLTRDAAKHLIDELKKSQPAAVNELIPEPMKLSEVQRVLQLLLREQISIRQLGSILEALGDHASRTKDPIALAEAVRRRQGRTICSRYRAADGKLYVVTLDPELEDYVAAAMSSSAEGLAARLPPHAVAAICRAIVEAVAQLARENYPPVVLVADTVRPALRQITASQLPRLVVLSYGEIPSDTPVESLALAHANESSNWQALQPAA
ncbi:MAG: flagellar biosynthesis protein FlhA [Pirellulales bacterium]|nr:flagellar biosynthesis protein FlhA [Pirellulales bacterium]